MTDAPNCIERECTGIDEEDQGKGTEIGNRNKLQIPRSSCLRWRFKTVGNLKKLHTQFGKITKSVWDQSKTDALSCHVHIFICL